MSGLVLKTGAMICVSMSLYLSEKQLSSGNVRFAEPGTSHVSFESLAVSQQIPFNMRQAPLSTSVCSALQAAISAWACLQALSSFPQAEQLSQSARAVEQAEQPA